MKKTIGFILIITILVIVLFIATDINEQGQEVQQNTEMEKQEQELREKANLPIINFSQTEHDFGILKQSGGIIQYDFPFTYNGEEEISITDVPTSCACTSAEINKETLAPGETAVITVSFDPNLHAEPKGKFFKTITLMTDPALDDLPELKIWAEIDLDLGPEAYKLQTHED